MMMLMTTTSTTFLVAFYSLYIIDTGHSLALFVVLIMVFDTINYGLLFRLVRLQVQLKASEENSNKIVASIKRINWT